MTKKVAPARPRLTISTTWSPEEIEFGRKTDALMKKRKEQHMKLLRQKHFVNDRHPDLKKLLATYRVGRNQKWGIGSREAMKRLLLAEPGKQGTIDIPEFVILGKQIIKVADWKLFDRLWKNYLSRNLPRNPILEHVRLNALIKRGQIDAAKDLAVQLKELGWYNHFTEAQLLYGLTHAPDAASRTAEIEALYTNSRERRKDSAEWPDNVIVSQLIAYYTRQRNIARINEIAADYSGPTYPHSILVPLIKAHWQIDQNWELCNRLFETFRATGTFIPRSAWEAISPVWDHMRKNQIQPIAP